MKDLQASTEERREEKQLFPKAFFEGIKILSKPLQKKLSAWGKTILAKLAPLLKKLGLTALKTLSAFLSIALSAFLSLASAVSSFIASTTAIVSTTSITPIIIIVLIIALVLIALLALFHTTITLPSAFVAFPQNGLLPSHPPKGTCKLIDPTLISQSLISIFEEAGKSFAVPPAVIAGIAAIEGKHLWNYNDTEILVYSLPGAQDPYNCPPNICGARGPMQFLTGEGVDEEKCPQAIGVDVWSYYKDAINEATGENRNPHVCNIKDSIFAAAKKLKKDSQTTQENNCQWSREEVYNSARGYYGKCEYKIKKGFIIIKGNYCQRVWEYYVNHS